MENKFLRGLIIGILLVGALWGYVKLIAVRQDIYGYGMAILPLILVSIILFIIGFVIGAFTLKNKNKKIKK